MLTAFHLAAGLALLIGGAHVLVRGASHLALLAGLSPLAVGLTIVAYGTSAPEMAVSVSAALQGEADIALGNVVGSNTSNILLILGASAVLAPMAIAAQIVAVELPIALVVAALAAVLAADGAIGRWDGLALAAFAAAYTYFVLARGKRASEGALAEPLAPEPVSKLRGIARDAGFIVAGLACLAVGGDWIVHGATAIATAFGISELVIGLTVVAVGTSLPELATSIIAALKGERDIAAGNIIGSNIFNLTAVLGLSATAAPAGVAASAQAIAIDIPVMIAATVLCFPAFLANHYMERWHGALFVALYAGYTTHLIAAANHHPEHDTINDVILYGLVPVATGALLWDLARVLYTRWR